MNRKKVINTFQGLDTDTSVNKYPPEMYVKCKNFRTLLDEENSSHALVNIKGNKKVLQFVYRSGDLAKIIGLEEFTDSIIVFVMIGRDNTSVFHIPKDVLDRDDLLNITVDFTSPSYSILRNKNFGFTEDSILKIICRKETEKIKKVYFTDGIQPLRFFNIFKDSLNEQDLNKFKFVPDVRYGEINIELSSGNFRAGKVGYSYQLYNLYGSESHFSPVSKLIDLYSSPLISIRRIRGNDIEKITTKGVQVTVKNMDNRFDRIRLVRVFYETFDVPPSIDVVIESGFKDSFIFTDRGLPGLDTYSVEEFNELLVDPIPQTMDSKNNYLFLGNITEDLFDPNWGETNFTIVT